MNYIDLNIRTNDSEQSEIFIAQLSDWPFDSFDDQEGVLHAYIRETDFAACREEVENLLQESGASFGTELIADRNWNEVWESNFEPIEVEGRCSIRAPFHVPRPDLPFDIVIMPKMAFGTGHHATTQLMVEEILDMPLDELCGLDMGSGTAVLSTRSTSTSGPMRTAVKTSQRTGSKTASRLGRAMHRCLPDAVTTSSWPISTATSCSRIWMPTPLHCPQADGS